MPSKQIRTGDIVMSADGKELGIVKQLGDTCFRVDAPRRRDFWLSNDAVEGRDNGIAVLLYDHNRLDDAFVAVLKHTGAHSHARQPSKGGGSLMKPVLMLAGMGAMAMRDKERREKVIEVSQKALTQARARLNRKKDGETLWEPPASTSGYSATSTFMPAQATATPEPARAPATEAAVSAPPPLPPSRQPTTAEDRKARQEAVIAEVTKAFPAMDLRISTVAVHTLEGKEVETLRFTLDETASADVQLDKLDRTDRTDEAVAQDVINDLRLQLPQEQHQES
jgi:hypothetical protein